MNQMEIERKFLIKEMNKVYPSPFPIEPLKIEIKRYGRNVTQHYLPLELIPEIKRELEFKIKFKIDQLRIRKIKKKCTLTIKSSGSTERHEFEKTITKEFFDKYTKYKQKTVKKIRLMKKYKNKFWFIDYYPKYSLIIAEIEFDDSNEAKNFNEGMKEITGVEKYKNKNLAK